jgi:sigma-B regulation protein RsbU (phosphoserine phosphatase)
MGEISGASLELLRSQLLDRRRRLEMAAEDLEAQRLLREVDSALERMEHGAYGLCQVCHEPLEEERLLADPLLRFCLDHLSASERRELEDDLRLAREIQRSLLPPCELSAAGWEACYHYRAASAIGGDYCDLIPCGAGSSLFFLTGDVSGKGVAAALLMSHLNAICRTLLAADAPVNALLEQVNRLFCNNTLSPHYATLLCGRAKPSGQVEIANAGHCPPLLVRDAVSEIEAGAGLPVGLFCNTNYAVHHIRFEPGESLILYTDGVTEAANAAGEEYGLDRLREAVSRAPRRRAQDLVGSIVAELARFTAGGRNSDDLTILVLRRSDFV